MWRAFSIAALVLGLAAPARADGTRIVVWHSYRGAEKVALEQVVDQFNDSRSDVEVVALAQPQDGYAAKITTAIPRDNGPDLFIFAHDRIGDWAESGIIASLGSDAEAMSMQFLPETFAVARYRDKLWGLPLAFKSTALFYNKKLIASPPATTDEMIELAKAHSGDGNFGLAYLYDDFYYHAAWHFGFGATLWSATGAFAIDSPESLAAMSFARSLQKSGVLPDEPTGALVAELFNTGRAAMVINGPWFVGEISPEIEFGVAPLPTISSLNRPARPFLSTEMVLVSARTPQPELALAVANHLAGAASAKIRALEGRQAVAHVSAWDDSEIAGDPVLGVFRRQLTHTEPMSTDPRARLTWEPFQLGLRKLFRRGDSPKAAAQAGQRRFLAIDQPAPPPANPLAYIIFIGLLGVVGLWLFLRSLRPLRDRKNRRAAARGWTWISPAVIGAVFLLFIPFIVGLVLSLFAHRHGDWSFVGAANFKNILFSDHYGIAEPLSFYFALVVTLLWTAVNLFLHVGIGLALALLLSKPALKLRPLYRVLFIIPWAVPNYITALIWKGIFDKQRGVINGIIEALGGDGVSWFSSFWTSFFANVCANAWLGFPFMMVVCLGALQSVPQDLYEAANVDGASPWQKFRHITLPLLKPAMVPAILIGTVWTFNQFNIVYLVSGGEPDNSTDILISEAYRWAFTRQEQYGYAAAYAALIFLLLLGWSVFAARVGRRMEAQA